MKKLPVEDSACNYVTQCNQTPDMRGTQILLSRTALPTPVFAEVRVDGARKVADMTRRIVLLRAVGSIT
jgi:hypothetical protein